MSKILIAYFSASGVTGRAAKEIAEAVGADLYEIRPEQPYTAADLDWRNKQSRSSLEMTDPDSRPAMAGPMPDLGEYDTVFVGFPIWWGVEPRAVPCAALGTGRACHRPDRRILGQKCLRDVRRLCQRARKN